MRILFDIRGAGRELQERGPEVCKELQDSLTRIFDGFITIHPEDVGISAPVETIGPSSSNIVIIVYGFSAGFATKTGYLPIGEKGTLDIVAEKILNIMCSIFSNKTVTCMIPHPEIFCRIEQGANFIK